MITQRGIIPFDGGANVSDWITTTEACKMSGYHPDHLRELLRDRKVEGRKFGPIWQVSRLSLQVYVRRMEIFGMRRGPKSKRV